MSDVAGDVVGVVTGEVAIDIAGDVVCVVAGDVARGVAGYVAGEVAGEVADIRVCHLLGNVPDVTSLSVLQGRQSIKGWLPSVGTSYIGHDISSPVFCVSVMRSTILILRSLCVFYFCTLCKLIYNINYINTTRQIYTILQLDIKFNYIILPFKYVLIY